MYKKCVLIDIQYALFLFAKVLYEELVGYPVVFFGSLPPSFAPVPSGVIPHGNSILKCPISGSGSGHLSVFELG
jgi:hypothetical protein